jgi:glucose dehydrogenase
MYTDPAKHGAIERPGGLGGVIAPLSLDPARHLAYLVTLDRPEYRHPVTDPTFDPKTGMYEAGDTTPTGSWTDSLVAVNVDNGKITWRQKLASGPILGHYGGRVVEGSLSVGDLVFASDPEGSFSAFDASTGEAKWHYQLGANAAQNMSPWSRFIDWMHAMKGAMLRRADPPAPLARVDASPVVYAIDGREYIAIGADLMPESSGGTSAITVFALPQP